MMEARNSSEKSLLTRAARRKIPEDGILYRCFFHIPVFNERAKEQLGTTLNAVMRVSILVTANVVPSSLILVAMKKEAIRSSETSVLTRAIRRRHTSMIHFI
jgi:hypothetical protein